MTKKITKFVLLFAIIVLAILVSLNLTSNADDIKITTEVKLDKYANYNISDTDKGTLVQYNLKLGMEYLGDYKDFPVKESEMTVNLNQIDGKYPSSVKVVSKSTQATNGKNKDIIDNYTYDVNNGNLVIKASNENENGDKIYNQAPNSNAKDEYLVICYYDTYTTENPERELACNVSAKTVLFENNREIDSKQEFKDKATENTADLTSIAMATSEVYNGKIKANIINGTQNDIEYKEVAQVVVSKKEEQKKLTLTQNATLMNNEKDVGNYNNVVYKSIKIKKYEMQKLLGEEGTIEILDANSNLIASINKDSEWQEDGTLVINYENELESLTVKTSEIQSEGVLTLYSTKQIKNTMKDINNNKIKSTITMTGINETKIQEETIDEETGEKTTQEKIMEEQAFERNIEKIIDIKDSTTNVTFNVSNNNWTNKQQNEITFDIGLNSNSTKYNLYKEPTLKIDLPNEVEKVIINDSSIVYGNGLELQKPYIESNKNGTQSIIAKVTGTQNTYAENSLGLITNVQIKATIILKKDIQATTTNVNLQYTNQYTLDKKVEVGNIAKEIKIENYKEENNKENADTKTVYDVATAALTNAEEDAAIVENADKITVEVSPVRGDTVLKDKDTVYEGEYIKYNIKVTNTADKAIDNIKVVGGVPEGTTYGELEAEYFTYQGKYEYKFDENIKEKTIDIGTLKAGESVQKFYEVKVNDLQNTEKEKNLETNIKAYIKTTEISSYKLTNVAKKADAQIFVDVKMDEGVGTDRWNYGVSIKGEQGKEVTVKIKFPKGFTFEGIGHKGKLYDSSEKFISISDDNIVTVNLKLDDDEDYSFAGTMDSASIEKDKDKSSVTLCTIATVTLDNKTYISNENRLIYLYPNASIEMSSPNEGEEVGYEQEIEYDIKIKNTGGTNRDISQSYISVNVVDFLPEGVSPISLTYETYENDDDLSSEEGLVYNTENKEFTKKEVTKNINYTLSDEEGNKLPNVDIYCTIPYKESVNVKIKAKAGKVYEKTKVENTATISSEETREEDGEEGNDKTYSIIGTKQSNTVTHTILPYNYEDTTEPEEPDNPDDPSNPDNPDDPSSEKYTISGLAWVDSNKDGQRQSSEKLLEGISVVLIDAESSNIVSDDVKTDSNGEYKFNDLKAGKYIVAFKYNKNTYRLTEYKKAGVANSTNSDVTGKEITLNGEKISAGVTDIIALDASVSNIDIGLIENEKCDLKLDKYITKVSVTTKNGTKEYNYDNKQLAKVEIRSKEIEGATVIVEYKLVITNEGEIPTTVTKLVDYVPDGLNFSSELNKNWSLTQNGELVNTSTNNQKIEPGKTLEVSLVLNKRMTSNATGTYTNTAEINEISNELGIKDIDSTPGNKVDSEDDYSKADLIISIGTGAFVYISIGMIVAILIGIVIAIRVKKGNAKIGKIFNVILFTLILTGTICLQYTNSDAMAIITDSKLDVTTYKAPEKAVFKFDSNTYYEGKGSYFKGGPYNTKYPGLSNIGGWCMHHGIPNQDFYGSDKINYKLGKATYSRVTKDNAKTESEYNGLTKDTSFDDEFAFYDNEKDNGRTLIGPFAMGEYECLTEGENKITVTDNNGKQIKEFNIYEDVSAKKPITIDSLGNSNIFYLDFSNESLKNGISEVKLENTVTYSTQKSASVTVHARYDPVDEPNSQPVGCEWKIVGKKSDKVKASSQLVWENMPINIKITKVDEKNNSIKLPGVQFKIMQKTRKQDTKGYQYEYSKYIQVLEYNDETGRNEVVKKVKGYQYVTDIKLVDKEYATIFETDDNGEIFIENLKSKKYKPIEIENNVYGYGLTDYEKENGRKCAEIQREDHTRYSGETANVTITNGRSTGDIQIKKKDYDTGNALKGVKFKIQDKNNEWIRIVDEKGNFKKEITRYRINKEYQTTTNKEEATVFITGEDGVINLGNIPCRKYTIVEESVGDNFGYEVNDDSIYWELEGYKNKWDKTKSCSIMVKKQETMTLVCRNQKKYTKISGYVWVDKIDTTKATERNNHYKTDDNDSNDESLLGIPVYLKNSEGQLVECEDKNGNYCNGRTTTSNLGLYDENNKGEYQFTKVAINQLENYHIEFEYDGITYTNVIVDQNADEGSKAKENADQRKQLNEKFTYIENGVAIDKNRVNKYELSYDRQGTESVFKHDAEFHIKNQNVDTIKAYTNEVDSKLLKNKYDKNSNEVKYINLGLYEREKPKYGIEKYLYNVKLAVNGYEHIYMYDNVDPATKQEESENKYKYDENGFNVGVRWERQKAGSYYRAIYKADAEYETTNKSNELQAYLTYRVELQNYSGLTGRINSIVDYYDERYNTNPDDNSFEEIIATTEVKELENNSRAKVVDLATKLNVTPDSQYNNSGYKKITIDNNQEGIIVSAYETRNIYIQFKLNRKAVLNILNTNEEGLLKNVAEINSYTTLDNNGNIYAGIDKASEPGNAIPGEESTYENDTGSAPTLKLEIATKRMITGKVFEDKAEDNQLMTGKVRQGSGKYEQGEQGIGDVIVTLKNETSGQIYRTKTVTEDGKYGFKVNSEGIYEPVKYNENDSNSYVYDAELTKGDFYISNYIPGEYTLTYTWGDATYTVQNYKGTVYKEDRNTTPEWYKIDENIRYTDATDDTGKRHEIDKEMLKNNKDGYFTNDDKQITTQKMDSTTPIMGIGIEMTTNSINKSGVTSVVGTKLNGMNFIPEGFNIKNVDFGIIERARQAIQVSKRIEKVQLTLANGQVIVDAKRNEKGELTGEMNHTQHMDPIENATDKAGRNNGYLKLELDNELMQGAILNIEYRISIKNISELDYNDDEFYLYGTIPENKKDSTVVKITPTKIIDYLGKGWAFNNSSGENLEYIDDNKIQDYVQKDVVNAAKDYSKLLINNTKDLAPGEITGTELITASKTLSTTDEITLNNEAELVELTKTGGSKIYGSTVGNYIPGNEENHESDDDMGETVIVTPATGKNLNYIIPVTVGVITLAILGTGIVLIKKKVLHKEEK